MSEHALQVAVAHMLQLVLDPDRTWWSAIDHGAGKLSKRSAGMMKARGVKRGIPDFIIMSSSKIIGAELIGIELKTDKGRLSSSQIETADGWAKCDRQIYIARSLEEVQEILDHCYIPMRHRMTMFGGTHDNPGRAARAGHQRARRSRKPKNPVPVLLGAKA